MKQFRQRLLCCCPAQGAPPPPGWTASSGEQAWGRCWCCLQQEPPSRGQERSLHRWWPQRIPPGLPWVAWAGRDMAHLCSSLLSNHDRCWMVERTTKATITAYLTLQTWSMRSSLLPTHFGVSVSADCCLPMLVRPRSWTWHS